MRAQPIGRDKDRWKCPTGKRRYRDEPSARQACRLLNDVSTRDKQASRWYPCGLCHGWHLTSHEHALPLRPLPKDRRPPTSPRLTVAEMEAEAAAIRARRAEAAPEHRDSRSSRRKRKGRHAGKGSTSVSGERGGCESP